MSILKEMHLVMLISSPIFRNKVQHQVSSAWSATEKNRKEGHIICKGERPNLGLC